MQLARPERTVPFARRRRYSLHRNVCSCQVRGHLRLACQFSNASGCSESREFTKSSTRSAFFVDTSLNNANCRDEHAWHLGLPHCKPIRVLLGAVVNTSAVLTHRHSGQPSSGELAIPSWRLVTRPFGSKCARTVEHRFCGQSSTTPAGLQPEPRAVPKL